MEICKVDLSMQYADCSLQLLGLKKKYMHLFYLIMAKIDKLPFEESINYNFPNQFTVVN